MFSSPASAVGEPSGYDFQKEENAAKWKGVFVNSLRKVHLSISLRSLSFHPFLSPSTLISPPPLSLFRSLSLSLSFTLCPSCTPRFLVFYYPLHLTPASLLMFCSLQRSIIFRPNDLRRGWIDQRHRPTSSPCAATI